MTPIRKFKASSDDTVTTILQTLHASDTSLRKYRAELCNQATWILGDKGTRVHLRLINGSIIPNVRITGIHGGGDSLVLNYRSPVGVQSLSVAELADIESFTRTRHRQHI